MMVWSRNKLCTKENYNNKVKENFRWRKREPPVVDSTFYGKEFPDPFLAETFQCMYFKQIFDDDLIKHIADQTNLYSVPCTGKSINVGENEIQQYCGILLLVSVIKLEQEKHIFWRSRTPSDCAAICRSL